MNIFITGSSGFVGKNLSVFLKEKGNILTPIFLRKDWFIDYSANVIIHLAGKANDTRKKSEEREYFEINTDLTKKIFLEFLNSNIKDFIYFSSIKAAADIVEGILDENYHSNPQTPYGKSKLLAEEFILKQKLPEGKRVFILRPCIIHGPGNKGNLNLIYRLVSKGIPWPLGDFYNQRSFCSIDNVCYIIHQILEREEIPSGIYNLADDDPLSTNELIQLIAKATNKKARIFNVSKKLIKATAKIGDKLRLPLNSKRLEKLTGNFVVSNAKIKTALQIEKLPISTKEGLIKTINSFN